MSEKIKIQLQCPIPKFDFDVITLGHGSGGLLTHRLLQTGVFNIFKNDLLDQQHDGAKFELNAECAFSTDSYVISPIFFPGGNIGDLAINGTVNDLAMCGALAKYLSLPLSSKKDLLWRNSGKCWSVLRRLPTKPGYKLLPATPK